METMFLVAGLAAAGLAGIAAAFYFSVRSSKGGNKRLRSAGAGGGGTSRAGASRHPGSRGGTADRDYQTEDDTGLDPALDFGDPVPRRRMGFRKGADIDEELWPTETFGGVSDEQFWDDLAADKALTTTARTAQDSGHRKRPLGTGPATGAQAPQAKREERGREDRSREDRSRGAGRRGAGSGAYPGSQTATQPVKTAAAGSQPASAAGTPVSAPGRLVSAPGRPVSVPGRPVSAPSRPVSAPGRLVSAPARPTGAPAQPAETRGRRRASSAEEDPLTSAAFSLRPSGPVDGRSSLRAGGSRPGGSAPRESANTYNGTSPYPHAGAADGDPSPVIQATTPPHGESYGHGRRSQPRPTGSGQGGQGTRPARHAYPQNGYPSGSRQGTGAYQGTGSYPTPGYPGNGYPGSGGYPGNGQRAPYEPRQYYRRLTHQR
jgi:hypothetical protein